MAHGPPLRVHRKERRASGSAAQSDSRGGHVAPVLKSRSAAQSDPRGGPVAPVETPHCTQLTPPSGVTCPSLQKVAAAVSPKGRVEPNPTLAPREECQSLPYV
eukprot:7779592-Pyramimonas_sp.AAC.1